MIAMKGVSLLMVWRRERDDRFKVIGQAYFQGFMDDEVFKMDDHMILRKRKSHWYIVSCVVNPALFHMVSKPLSAQVNSFKN